VVGARQELEHSVGLEVVVRAIDILIESGARLSRTGGIGGLSGSDIVLSGPTEGEDWDEQYEQVATHSHCCTHTHNTGQADAMHYLIIDTQLEQRLNSTTIAILTDNLLSFTLLSYSASMHLVASTMTLP